MKARKSRATNDESFELKYCERCGGLWLRPVSGGQIYCVACSARDGQAATLLERAGESKRRRAEIGRDEGSPESYERDDDQS